MRRVARVRGHVCPADALEAEPTASGASGRLRGRVALVTGATSGIGAATARLLAKEGAAVVATGRNQQALDDFVREITEAGGSAVGVAGDATDDASVARVVDEASKAFGKLNILVNCAGVMQGGATDAATLANYDFNMSTNARAPFCFLMHAVPHLKAQPGGVVVNVSSVNGMHSFAGCAAYCMSKAATDMLTRCASVDLAPYGIRVNSVNPGVVITELQKRGGMGDAAYEAFLQRCKDVTHPLAKGIDRLCQPEEVAEVIAFLASDQSSYMTGALVPVDGGRLNLGAR